MAKSGELLDQLEPRAAGPTPMLMEVSRDLILRLVNEELVRRRQSPLPHNVSMTIHVPGGGDWSNDDLELETITCRWLK